MNLPSEHSLGGPLGREPSDAASANPHLDSGAAPPEDVLDQAQEEVQDEAVEDSAPPYVAPLAGRAPLDALLEALDHAAHPSGPVEAHTAAFVAWITADEEALRTASALADAAARLDGAARTYRHVAVLGYAAALGLADRPHQRAALTEGLEWLAGREWFAAGRVPTFEADPVALLGVALGIQVLSSTTRLGSAGAEATATALTPWVSDLLMCALGLTADSWERGVVEAARYLVEPTTASVARIGEAAPDLAAALCARALVPSEAVSERAAMDTVLALTYRSAGAERAATQRVALRWLFRATPAALPGRATVADVIAVLKGIERSLRRWRWEEKPSTRNAPLVQWAVNNEYHMQDLLWVVLAPLFPDLEDEENLPSLGQKHPRYDLGIPSLQLLIEAKFVRRGDTREFSDVIEQVAADASLYLRDPARYNRLVAVVWDDSRHTEQYAELVQGLMAIAGVAGAVVLTRPGRMGEGLRAASALAPTDGADGDVPLAARPRRP